MEAMIDRVITSATALKEAKAEAAEIATHMRRLFRMMPHMVAVFSLDTERFIFASQGFERILGYTQEQLLTTNPYEWIRPDERPAGHQIQDSMAGHGSVTTRYTNHYLCADGQYVELQWSVLSKDRYLYCFAQHDHPDVEAYFEEILRAEASEK